MIDSESFKMGFNSHLEKDAALPKKLMEIGKYLKSTVVPKLVGGGKSVASKALSKGKSMASEYAASHGPALLGGAAGFTAASGLYNNLAKGDDLDAGKLTDSLAENIKDFGMFDIGLFGLSKAYGGMKPLLSALKSKIGLIAGGAAAVAGKAGSKAIKKTIDASTLAGKNYAKGLSTPGTSKLISSLPLIGASVGAMTEYDEDSPVSSVARGAIGGGIAGGLIGAIPGAAGPKTNFNNSMLDSLQAGLGFSAVGGALERKAKRQRKKRERKYYEILSSKFKNPPSIPGGAFRGY